MYWQWFSMLSCTTLHGKPPAGQATSWHDTAELLWASNARAAAAGTTWRSSPAALRARLKSNCIMIAGQRACHELVRTSHASHEQGECRNHLAAWWRGAAQQRS